MYVLSSCLSCISELVYIPELTLSPDQTYSNDMKPDDFEDWVEYLAYCKLG